MLKTNVLWVIIMCVALFQKTTALLAVKTIEIHSKRVLAIVPRPAVIRFQDSLFLTASQELPSQLGIVRKKVKVEFKT